ncbi:MAG TPA: hypothetical protein VD838_17955, partial [Anaeromyxobacteraceae bacterium]|nr:hypothetical protein [Anaeromyxobacteraceae bacterium]
MSGPPPGLRIRFLHLAVLSTFAFAQPLFGTLAANPLFLEVRGAGAVEVWSLVAAALLGPPALLAAIEGGA